VCRTSTRSGTVPSYFEELLSINGSFDPIMMLHAETVALMKEAIENLARG
jgi:hypothetical protein